MFHVLLASLSALSSFNDHPALAEPKFPEAAVVSDTVPRSDADIEKWPAITKQDAQALATQQGDAWKKAIKDQKILIGAGPNGADKLKTLLNSSDSVTRWLYEQLVKNADAGMAKPLPDYYDPSFAVSKGQTLASAQPQLWMRPWGDQVVILSVMAAISDNAAYKQRLHDLVLRLCKFPAWGMAPLNGDLAAAHVARGIAVAWNWQPNLWSADERSIIIDTMRSRVNALNAGTYGNKIWWGGCYTSNINQVCASGAGICGVAFLNDIPEANEWLAASWLNAKQIVNHSYPDGSSAEGTAYWTYGISFLLQFIEAADGVLPAHTLYNSAFLKNAAAFRINSSTPGFGEIISWGDSDPHDFYGPMHYMLRLSSQYNDGQAKYLATHSTQKLGGNDDVKAWAWLWSYPSVPEQKPAKCDFFASTSNIVNSRSGWGDDDYVLTFKSGYTNRSHSHLDEGSIGLIVGNDWILPTPRYGKGRVNGDFWDRAKGGRWRYQSNSTEANSTLVINKQQQRTDLNAKAVIDHYASYDNAMVAESDLSGVYNGATTARRKLFHRRGEYIIVNDDVTLAQPGQTEWLIQVPPNAVINDNTVNIQGRSGSANITMLSPRTSLALREPVSENKDVAELRKTMAASITGKTATFTAVIEPKISGREQVEREYSVDASGAIVIKSPGAEERLVFADNASDLSDEKASVAATARMLYTKTAQGNVSEVIVEDAKKISAGKIQLSAGTPFSADLVQNNGKWKLTVGEGKNINIKGASVSKINGKAGVQIDGPGDYMIQ